MKRTYQKGKFAEFWVALILQFKGYKILKKRYRNYFGEIDIIAKKSNIIIAVEVWIRTDSTSSSSAVL